MSRGGPGVRRVSWRFNADGEVEVRCDSCASSGQTKAYWPATLEFWNPKEGLQNCRACHRIRRRMRHRDTAEDRRRKQRDYYKRTRADRLAARHRRYQRDNEEINRKRREKYAASKVTPAP